MPSLKYVIELSAEDKAKLIEIVTKGKSPARTILRANILLTSDRGNEKYRTVSETSKACHTTPTIVQNVRASYREKGLEATINRLSQFEKVGKGLKKIFYSTNFINKLRYAFSLVFQFLPIGIMILLQELAVHAFDIEDYVGNLLVFDMVTCITTISSILIEPNKRWKEWEMTVVSFILLIVLCFSIILYCLVLIEQVTDKSSTLQIVLYISIGFAVVIGIIDFLCKFTNHSKG